MAFTGKATYSAGANLPELAEDIADLVSICAPQETPLLDALGDATRAARSTVHEWLEDSLLPNTDTITEEAPADPLTDQTFHVANADRFRVGDQIIIDGRGEVMLVSAVDSAQGTVTVERGYGGSEPTGIYADAVLRILGNAALEGEDAGEARFTTRVRRNNFTQIFTSTVEVSGSELAVRQVGVADELDYQKQQRTRELLRDLENCVINGVAPRIDPQGSATVRRSMRGIVSMLSTNRFTPGDAGMPDGAALSEEQLNFALRQIWQSGNSQVDLIVVGGRQKRQINQFVAANRRYTGQSDSYRDAVSIYESDFGICRVLLSRWVPEGTVLLLDSSRIDVLPLAGRSFQFKRLASTGDLERGQVIGEYTLELRNENAHGIITGLWE